MFGKVTTYHNDGLIEVEITAATAPQTFPLVSDGIDNLIAGMTLAPGSTLLTTSDTGLWILNDNYMWVKQI